MRRRRRRPPPFVRVPKADSKPAETAEPKPAEADSETLTFESIDESMMQSLGRDRPVVLKSLLESVGRRAYAAFQSRSHDLTLTRGRLRHEASALTSALDTAEGAYGGPAVVPVVTGWGVAGAAPTGAGPAEWATQETLRCVLITGFEAFNQGAYAAAADALAAETGGRLQVRVFSDRDLASRRPAVSAALDSADVLLASLLFDYDQVAWLKAAAARVPLRLVFESALELMALTSVAGFTMGGAGASGPPAAVKALLSKFGSGREEDRMVGYLAFLKIGPKLLQFVPGAQARDLRAWLTAYSYWNQGGPENVASMFRYLAATYFPRVLSSTPGGARLPPPPIETPPVGLYHPARAAEARAAGETQSPYFSSPAEYVAWARRRLPPVSAAGIVTESESATAVGGNGAGRAAVGCRPVVAVLLYRKHVISRLPYVDALIEGLEAGGLLPVPIFINGVEAHVVARDWLTTTAEQDSLSRGAASSDTLRPDAACVDAIVSTIGFPLVGGPAGTMEGGRQSEISAAILRSKDVPYLVAAPLLVQDVESWTRDGVQGLQSVVLYALPELDGAIDTVALGGLVGQEVLLAGERVSALAARLRSWVGLRRSATRDRRVAVVVYGFPPGVGATGTAALLHVPKSLEAILGRLKAEGYDLGPEIDSGRVAIDGEATVAALRSLDDERVVALGEKVPPWVTPPPGGVLESTEVTPSALRRWLTFPLDWGPSEWGPIPFLPDPDILVKRMEAAWGPLDSYRGLRTSAAGNFVASGIRYGNVLVCVQPLLGVEGDPMRLLFERDLTPHPQYAAFYKRLQAPVSAGGCGASAVVHLGMHGTEEWLPGSPLGNTGLSWSDTLIGQLPNVYVYAANNPSESIVAKRRGYGTIVSYNVPPYGRSGLYKQLATLRDNLRDFREASAASAAAGSGAGGGAGATGATDAAALRPVIAEIAEDAGLLEDVPFAPFDAPGGQATGEETDRLRSGAPAPAFAAWAAALNSYLQELESRLFSEGLHVLGTPPTASQMAAYLTAYFGPRLPSSAIEAVVAGRVTTTAAAVAAETLPEFESSAAAAAAADPNSGDGPAGWGVHKGDALAALTARLREAEAIRGLLARTGEELDAVVHALGGGYIPAAAGGDLLRDGPGVLPTGRNIHALDPYRMPSPAAAARGAAAAQAILAAHLESEGRYPETVAVMLWGLDAIKTKGESLGICLELLGARAVKEATGRVAAFELVPLEELVPSGRPRIDVLASLSGIFRDSFANVVDLLDDLFARCAAAEEPLERNFVRKHALALAAAGVERPAARLFSNPAGDYGSMVNERVGASDWESSAELGDTWRSRNAFSYGRGGERGAARPEVISALLATTGRVVQEVDSVEYGLSDIQEYYANTGALVAAAKAAQAEPGKPAARVGCSVVEAFSREVKPRELEDVLRREYRTKLLNPRWAAAMADQGSGGGYEISQRMTALLGWGATADFSDPWVYDGAHSTYVEDEAMRAKLRRANPQAYGNVVRRLLEAASRGLWSPDEATIDKLKELYEELDAELEGVGR